MLQQKMRWLIDLDLPPLSQGKSDTVHLSERGRDAIMEAVKDDRAVVTTNRFLMESRTIPFNCPAIVILEQGDLPPEALQRNLTHFEFCLSHDMKKETIEGQRFYIEADRAIYRIKLDGGLEEMEAWKTPSINPTQASDASV